MEIRKLIKDYSSQFYSHITENAIDIEDYLDMCLLIKTRQITRKFYNNCFLCKNIENKISYSYSFLSAYKNCEDTPNAHKNYP